ncbi:zinc protease [Acinetobacter bereziniae]|uniref:zinc protease n=1 Tax=Acinetobacter bereziniae TaxID=106648 RepID=UPI0019004390|nr:zinc protease [Acinetobacter bereziniae]MBJ8453481.1 zinc protease [Acinetobacter bereziniae]MBJ8457613.1 zinc protease [Acinetobacter bereziniae]
MDKNPIKAQSKILIANATAKLNKLSSGKAPPTTELKIKTRRNLTAGEILMCQQIFKNAIDYSKVLLHRGILGFESEFGVTPNGEIYFPVSEYDAIQDFSNSKVSGESKCFFIHEMTHVWQYQMGIVSWLHGLKHACKLDYASEGYSNDLKTKKLKGYITDILGNDKGKKFNEFNMEQQAELVEMWFDAGWLQHVNPKRNHHIQSVRLSGEVEKILRDFLINPSDKSQLPINP